MIIIAISTKIGSNIQPTTMYIKNDILRKNEVMIIEDIQEKIPNKDDFITVTTTRNKRNAIILKRKSGNTFLIVIVNCILAFLFQNI